jgi:hypothetical protein
LASLIILESSWDREEVEAANLIQKGRHSDFASLSPFFCSKTTRAQILKHFEVTAGKMAFKNLTFHMELLKNPSLH